jgi:hypothetical protein
VRNAFYFFRFRNFNEQIISEQHFSDFYVVISNRFHSQEPAQHCRGEQRGTQQEIAREACVDRSNEGCTRCQCAQQENQIRSDDYPRRRLRHLMWSRTLLGLSASGQAQ